MYFESLPSLESHHCPLDFQAESPGLFFALVPSLESHDWFGSGSFLGLFSFSELGLSLEFPDEGLHGEPSPSSFKSEERDCAFRSCAGSEMLLYSSLAVPDAWLPSSVDICSVAGLVMSCLETSWLEPKGA